jgi:hypothetical protein
MNSRIRRKLDAEKHNAILVENEAYREDRARYPRRLRASRKGQQMLSLMAITGASLSIPYTNEGAI